MRADHIEDLREDEIAEAEFFFELGAVSPDAVGGCHGWSTNVAQCTLNIRSRHGGFLPGYKAFDTHVSQESRIHRHSCRRASSGNWWDYGDFFDRQHGASQAARNS